MLSAWGRIKPAYPNLPLTGRKLRIVSSGGNIR